MDFNHPEERRMLADTVGRFLADTYALDARHAAAASERGFSAEAWAQFADLGVIGALFNEQHGGFGGAPFDLSVIFEQLGRGLVVEPFLASAVLGGGLLAELGNDRQRRLIDTLIGGETLLAFAHGEPDSRYDISHVATRAEPAADGWVLNGRKAVVLNGDSADYVIVSARTGTGGDAWDEHGLSLFLLPADAPGIERRGYPTIDGLHAAEIQLDAVPAGRDTLLGELEQAFPAIEKTVARATLALCAEALGLMEVCRDMTLEYFGTRKQFGVPIGAFQALQHRMATLMMEIEQARSIVINAAGRFDRPRDEREKAVSAAKALVGRVGRLVAEESIQMHGGIAMTWEYGLGHYAKRLVMIDHQFGDVDHHTKRYAELSSG